MRNTYVIASVIAAVILVWLGSGIAVQEDVRHASLADQNRDLVSKQADLIPTKVRVRVIEASERYREVEVRGRTKNKRTVEVKVETPGRILARQVERGTAVSKGDLLCKISMEDRRSSLIEAKEMLNQARIEYQGALRLKEKGYNSDTAIAMARARLASAEANLDRRNIDIAKTNVRAPFAGIIEDVHQEIGDFVMPGAPCATVVDLNPMLLVGRVTERVVQDLTVGTVATGIMSDDRTVQGIITFIGQQSDPSTRTFPIEIQVENSLGQLRSGITTQIKIPTETVMAQMVSPALFSLDDQGRIGIRTIDTDNVVRYFPVAVLSDAPDGVWVTGLPNRTTIITVGHQLVVEGESVDPVYEGVLPANSTTQPNVESAVNRTPTKRAPATAAL
jgi:multidrug efflux system membrane fusion protein